MAEENQDPIGDGTEEPSDAAVQEPEALDEGEAEEPKDKKKKKLECPACEAGAPCLDGHVCRYGYTAHGVSSS
jgi:hypothetical protein